MRLLNAYIRKQVIWSTAVVVLVLIGIQSFLEFVGQLSDIGKGHYTVWQAFLFVPLQLPTNLYQLFPMAGFLGSLIGLGHLASSSQLIVMRAAGVSILQITWSVIKAAVIMIVFVTVVGEWLAPQLQTKATHIKAVSIGKYDSHRLLTGVWLREKNAYIRIEQVLSPTSISGVHRFDFDAQNHLIRAAYAPTGKKVNNAWVLYQLQETLFKKDKVFTKRVASEPLNILFEPQLLKKAKEAVDHQSIRALFHNILYREKTGLVTSEYQYAFWKRIIQPITTIVMICLGIPFVFGSLRSSSMGFRVMTGVIIGFGFYMLNQFFGPITLVYQFPPLLSASLPTVLFLIAYAILFRRIH